MRIIEVLVDVAPVGINRRWEYAGRHPRGNRLYTPARHRPAGFTTKSVVIFFEVVVVLLVVTYNNKDLLQVWINRSHKLVVTIIPFQVASSRHIECNVQACY